MHGEQHVYKKMPQAREAVDRDGKKYTEVDSEKSKPFIGLVRQFMTDAGLRGNPADYAVLYGSMLTDVWGHYAIQRVGLAPVGKEGQQLSMVIHKRFLYQHIRRDQAEMFWNHKLGMRRKPLRHDGVRFDVKDPKV